MAHRERMKPSMMGRVFVNIVYLGFLCTSDCYAKVLGVEKRQQSNQNILYEPLMWDGSTKEVQFSYNYLPDMSFSDEGRPKIAETTTLTTHELNSEFHKIILVVRPDSMLTKVQVMEYLQNEIAKLLRIPVANVKVLKYEVLSDGLVIYFGYRTRGGGGFDLYEHNSVFTIEQLQKESELIEIESLKFDVQVPHDVSPTQSHKVLHAFSYHHWKAWQLAIIIACALFAIFAMIIIVYILRACHYLKTASTPIVEERQVVLHPVMKPDVTEVNVIQPGSKDNSVGETDSEHTPSPCCSPMRAKGKGLLERRGSNASLTLDLNRSQENIHYGTPPKECSTEEYLLSSGHRLGRKQLHNCMKDVKALHSEFWEIPMNHPEKVEVAGSGTKNRYKTILPNENTRVVLKNTSDDDQLTTYINANYIRGYAGEKNAYIATQGPMAHTVGDFWTMVWEQKSPIIVMITKLKEKLKVKCECYVPDTHAHYIGIDVTVLRVIPRDGYVIRELLLTKGGESHTVCHFWYTAWPDHKTPDTAKQLLAMALEVDSLRHNGNGTTKGPTVVHCSAGIGRTGCFIAISIGIQQLLEENEVDILGIVCGLRLDRGGMVQTAEQYEFVHQALGVFELTVLDQSGE